MRFSFSSPTGKGRQLERQENQGNDYYVSSRVFDDGEIFAFVFSVTWLGRPPAPARYSVISRNNSHWKYNSTVENGEITVKKYQRGGRRGRSNNCKFRMLPFHFAQIAFSSSTIFPSLPCSPERGEAGVTRENCQNWYSVCVVCCATREGCELPQKKREDFCHFHWASMMRGRILKRSFDAHALIVPLYFDTHWACTPSGQRVNCKFSLCLISLFPRRYYIPFKIPRS